MEQIVKENGVLYYGEEICVSVDDAYSKFRKDYHKSIGRASYKRLDRLGQRKERIHGYGFVFEPGYSITHFTGKKTVCRILGLVGISYVRIVGIWDYSEVQDEDFERWIDYAFSRGSGALRTVGLNLKVGRTSKRLKKRYR